MIVARKVIVLAAALAAFGAIFAVPADAAKRKKTRASAPVASAVAAVPAAPAVAALAVTPAASVAAAPPPLTPLVDGPPTGVTAASLVDQPEAHQFDQRVRLAFMNALGIGYNADFIELDAAARALRDGRQLFPAGDYKLARFYDASAMPIEHEHTLPVLDAWIAAMPQSPTPRIVKALVRLQGVIDRLGAAFHGREATQHVVVDQVALAAIRADLLADEKICAGDPHWHYLLARIAMLMRVPEAELSAIVLRGLAVAPGYQPLIAAGTDYFLPKWSGNAGSLQEWARKSDDVLAARGAGFYAKAYVHAHQVQFGRAMFEQSAIDWTRFKASAAQWLAVVGPSPEALSDLSALACLAGDRQETARLFAMIKTPYSTKSWSSKDDREACKAWAEKSGVRIWVEDAVASIGSLRQTVLALLWMLLARG